MAVHGIRPEMLQDAPRWGEVWDEFEPILAGRLMGVYNADFDLRMMRQSHARSWMSWVQPEGLEVFCIMNLYAQYHGEWNARRGSYRWQSLDTAGRQCGIPLPNSHRALDDTLLTRAVLKYIAESG